MNVYIKCASCQEPATMICTKEGMTYQGEDGITRPILYPLCSEHYWPESRLFRIVYDAEQ